VLANERSATSRRSIRSAIAILSVLLVIGGSAAKAADAPNIKIKAGGKLMVPQGAPLGVIATDPVLQQILSEDLRVAGRLADPNAASALTLTATLTQRVLEPGMSLNDVTRGDQEALALLRAAGITPPPVPESETGPGSTEMGTAAQGNARVPDDVRSYEEEGREMESPPQPGTFGSPLNPFPTSPWPVPPATAQGRSVLPPYQGTYQPYQANAPVAQNSGAIYDTVFVARTTIGSSGGALTVIAVAHPGYNAREVKKLVAEEIANAVLH
jgi:hypothetical protein